MIANEGDWPWRIETIAHELILIYLTIRPLGLLYRCLPPNDANRAKIHERLARLDPLLAMRVANEGARTAPPPAARPPNPPAAAAPAAPAAAAPPPESTSG
jgi:hypothetical protein